MSKNLASPPAIKRGGNNITEEHLQWLYNKLVQLPTPISATNLTKAVGRVMGFGARMDALEVLEQRGKINIEVQYQQNKSRRDKSTWYSPVLLTESRQQSLEQEIARQKDIIGSAQAALERAQKDLDEYVTIELGAQYQKKLDRIPDKPLAEWLS